MVSPWNLLAKQGRNPDEILDEQVFVEEMAWSNKSKPGVALPSNNEVWELSKPDVVLPSSNEVWELSSSPTSSVSSSKVELTNILDNDSGMSSSNPLGPTPPSVQSESRISFQEQPFLDTPIEHNPWAQSRGSYSAPSSPALQRNSENHSRVCVPSQQTIRSHPSMDELNSNRPWKKNYSEAQHTSGKSSSSPLLSKRSKASTSTEARDSGLSSPHGYTERRSKNQQPDSLPATSTTAWSAERFQNVQTTSDLLYHLSLDKYGAKLEVSGVV